MSLGVLTRIYEIRDCVLKAGSGTTFFENFDNPLAARSIRQKHFQHIEAELAGLDPAAWMHLKDQVVPLFQARHRERDWQAAFDKLNEAKAYNYLAQNGCTQLAFIPVSTKQGQKTPDLGGKLDTRYILCEVKTINPSDAEAAARSAVAKGLVVAGCTQGSLPDAFFDKLTATLNVAKTQMTSYDSDDAVHFVYVILNFDDTLNEYVDNYLKQIDSFVTTTNDLPTIGLVFDVKSAFYSATSESSSSQLFAYSCDGNRCCRLLPASAA